VNVAAEFPSSSIPIKLPQGGERRFYYRPGTSDEAVIKQVLINNEYDVLALGGTPREHRVTRLAEILRNGLQRGKAPLIVDAGANIGASSLVFTFECPDALVIAIEPEPGNFRLLERNIGGMNTKCIHAAVASRPGRINIVDPGKGHWGYRTEASRNGSVVCIMINDIYRQHAATHFPFIVKIDIEGGEADLFSANSEWVRKTPLLIVELHDWLIPQRGISRSFLKCVAQLDRDLVNTGENTYYSIRNDL